MNPLSTIAYDSYMWLPRDSNGSRRKSYCYREGNATLYSLTTSFLQRQSTLCLLFSGRSYSSLANEYSLKQPPPLCISIATIVSSMSLIPTFHALEDWSQLKDSHLIFGVEDLRDYSFTMRRITGNWLENVKSLVHLWSGYKSESKWSLNNPINYFLQTRGYMESCLTTLFTTELDSLWRISST